MAVSLCDDIARKIGAPLLAVLGATREFVLLYYYARFLF